jgi:phytoene/squalene synthetase
MARFAVSEEQIARGETGGRWREFMAFQVERARALMNEGAPLGRALRGRIGLELRMIVAGGLRILEKIEQTGGDVFNHRPVLRPLDWPVMLLRAVR